MFYIYLTAENIYWKSIYYVELNTTRELYLQVYIYKYCIFTVMYITVMNNASMQGLKMQRLEERWENSCFRCKRDTWHLHSKHILPAPKYRSQLSKISACTCKWELNVLVPLQLHLNSWFTRLIIFLIRVTLLTIKAFVGLHFPDTDCPVSELVDMIE